MCPFLVGKHRLIDIFSYPLRWWRYVVNTLRAEVHLRRGNIVDSLVSGSTVLTGEHLTRWNIVHLNHKINTRQTNEIQCYYQKVFDYFLKMDQILSVMVNCSLLFWRSSTCFALNNTIYHKTSFIHWVKLATQQNCGFIGKRQDDRTKLKCQWSFLRKVCHCREQDMWQFQIQNILKIKETTFCVLTNTNILLYVYQTALAGFKMFLYALMIDLFNFKCLIIEN